MGTLPSNINHALIIIPKLIAAKNGNLIFALKLVKVDNKQIYFQLFHRVSNWNRKSAAFTFVYNLFDSQISRENKSVQEVFLFSEISD